MSWQKQAWATVPLEQLGPSVSRRFITGKQVMIAQFHLSAGCIVPKHHHRSEQITYIVSGALRFWLGDCVDSDLEQDSVLVSSGELLVVPANVPHRAIAHEDTLNIDVFSPPREDWIAGTDTYLRGQ